MASRKRRENYTANLSERILDRDNWTCVYCGAPAGIVDHVVPVAAGGPGITANGVASCTSCNHRKSAKLRLEQLTRAFLHLQQVGESIEWVAAFMPTGGSVPAKRSKAESVRCEWCGDEFTPRRWWQQYCSDSHRVMAARSRREARLSPA
jgi:hypothetical protein